mmetsp:Transcript_89374/g.273702  ORF Transcript_89374/g.273702 Transcript_89374/m.273702 type:complete len:221 (+) Transcript_89374:972-1634(+)
MPTKLPATWTMVKVKRKHAERMVPLRLLSKLNFRLPVKNTVLSSMMMRLKARKMIAPRGPGMPPLPSGGGRSSSTTAGGATAAEAPDTGPFSTGPLGFPGNMFFSTVPGLWMQFHSSLASLPAYAMMAWTPPGCTCTHFVTSYALPLMTTHTSASVVCFATSSMVSPPSDFAPPPAAAGAAAPPKGPFKTGPLPPSGTKFFSTVPGLWIMFHSSEASWPR